MGTSWELRGNLKGPMGTSWEFHGFHRNLWDIRGNFVVTCENFVGTLWELMGTLWELRGNFVGFMGTS